MDGLEHSVNEIRRWFSQPRFEGIRRLYSAQQVAEQSGTIMNDYTIARRAAEDFYARLRQLFRKREQITTFGPYSPGQAVAMKRMGIEGIYLGGWATSAKGSVTEDPGPDLASYPLSQVPDEAAAIVRALLAADKNEHYTRIRSANGKGPRPESTDFTPFIIADADTGHGGEAHVRNLIRRFVEAGVPGYHIEDQKPGVKKCGHQAGKVLVAQDEQIKRLNAARFQLDVMRVPGIVVARTDAEAATFIDRRGDERDELFILGATNVDAPSYRVVSLAILKRFTDRGVEGVNGHLIYDVSETEYKTAYDWLKRAGVMDLLDNGVHQVREGKASSVESALDAVNTKCLEAWQAEAGLMTYAQAVADVIQTRTEGGERFGMNVEQWSAFAERASVQQISDAVDELGLNIKWDPELPRTPEGYYLVQGGLSFAIARSLAAAPYADLLWMETKTANLGDAQAFAEAIHAEFPDKMLAYNLSPSFNWDTTGMTDEQMQQFPAELGRLGYVFNFITYGGHQIDGLASEEFAAALKQDGMLALARLQRKLRLLESPYKTPQTLVGGSRIDAALMASTGHTATTKAMSRGSTQFQHLVQTELPPKLLEDWLELWSRHHQVPGRLRVELRPHTVGSELLALTVYDAADAAVACVVFAPIWDRRKRSILSVRDQGNYIPAMRRKRLMTLMLLFLIHRYRCVSVHFVTPNENNQRQAERMQELGIFRSVNHEIGQIIVAEVDTQKTKELIDPDRVSLTRFITKGEPSITDAA